MFKINGPWLIPGEQDEVIHDLVCGSLVKWDNARNLPLKSGGKTDVYINIRDARSRPKMIRRLAEVFENPIRRLRPDRIVEVPEAITPVAGHLSAMTGIPLVTIREEEKPGRVVKGRAVGDLRAGERVVITDDVITDGESKLAALRFLRDAGVEVLALVVLVDRQQGWKKKLAEAGFGDIQVWAGMTLHDVRKNLISERLMQRCDPALEAKNPIIVALDGKPWEEYLPIVDRLRPGGCILKANDLLLEDDVNTVIRNLGVYGRVMADAKLHDIPNTVANFCSRIGKTPPWGLTVHASGGSEMIKAAVKTLTGTPTIVLAVTVLTSLGDQCEEIYARRPLEEVRMLANIAYKAGARGFVCSSEEVEVIRGMYPDATIVVPALHSPKNDAPSDQRRTGTFIEAKKKGADFLVGGRQFTNAEDPVAEIQRVLKEELAIGI
ncbi:MAG: orotidine-5-phosphate decarboxylase [Candidatus Parcubacteria bacterium]|nr:orotidine-5-phosphate decarboxylase [Candidatus Parcubacteria bacterium]